MGRTSRFQELKEAHVKIENNSIHVNTLPPRQIFDNSGLKISCRELDWQLSSVAQVFTSFFPSIHMVEHLYVYEPLYEPPYNINKPQYDIENMQWLEKFQPFSAVKNLYLSKEYAPYISPALQELVGGTLQNILLERLEQLGPILEGIQKFVAARKLSGHPITISIWERGLGQE
jgi:hypothetical protein